MPDRTNRPYARRACVALWPNSPSTRVSANDSQRGRGRGGQSLAIGPKDRYTHDMEAETTNASLADWSPDQIELGRRWVQAWQTAGPELERVRREELRRLDGLRAVSLRAR